MSEDSITLISVGIGAIVFIFCYIKVFLKGKSREQRFIAKAKEQGSFVEGNYVGYRRSLGAEDEVKISRFKYDTYIVKYEYKVNGKIYYKKMRFLADNGLVAKYPYRVTVYYNPKNPRRAVCPEEASRGEQMTRGFYITIILTLVTIGIVARILKMF